MPFELHLVTWTCPSLTLCGHVGSHTKQFLSALINLATQSDSNDSQPASCSWILTRYVQLRHKPSVSLRSSLEGVGPLLLAFWLSLTVSCCLDLCSYSNRSYRRFKASPWSLTLAFYLLVSPGILHKHTNFMEEFMNSIKKLVLRNEHSRRDWSATVIVVKYVRYGINRRLGKVLKSFKSSIRNVNGVAHRFTLAQAWRVMNVLSRMV